MENRYAQKFYLRTSDFDCHMQLKPSAVLDLFQEVAGAHAEELGIGFNKLLENNLLWVITKVKYQVVGKVEMHKPVTVHTWPLKPARVAFQREYLIENENGETVIKGSSEWVTMHSEKRRLVPMNDIYPLEEFCEDKMFEGRLVKVSDFDSAQYESLIRPAFCDLDMNGHVNNIKYADFVLNTVDLSTSQIDTFQIDYHREVQKDMPLSVLVYRSDKDVLAKGVSEAGEKMFSCQILVK